MKSAAVLTRPRAFGPLLLIFLVLLAIVLAPAPKAKAAEEPPVINGSLTLTGLGFSYNPADNRAPAGVYTITATWTNFSGDTFSDVYSQVTTLTGGNTILNADSGSGVGAISYADLGGDGVLSFLESFTITYEVGMQQAQTFNFFVDLHGISAAN